MALCGPRAKIIENPCFMNCYNDIEFYFLCYSPHRSTATWPLEPPTEEQGWRHIRLQQTGKNASGQTHYLSLSGFEIYGTVTGIIEEALGKSATID